ncbi:hypothetical protein RHMOL_Rhmol05G0149200 [Rhododendron molle]|uniref:Uncharacterized protein n=1 Tax=Rhododendron molle TaxID=49168 RepID=A0ACC0NPI2_RHOML|nr:hypothetical protein RHMOL_Rhmol05G0149200 [Rhododendron molle]
MVERNPNDCIRCMTFVGTAWRNNILLVSSRISSGRDKATGSNATDRVTRKENRIILVKLVIGESIINIISAYATQVGLDDLTKEQFWEQMDDVVQGIPFGEKLFIGGDFNGHVGVHKQGYEEVHGDFGFGDLKEGGRRILYFAVTFDLIVGNTL